MQKNLFSLEETFKIRNPQEYLGPLGHRSFKSQLFLFVVAVLLFMQDCFHTGLILMANTTAVHEDERTLHLPSAAHQKATFYLAP